jgi:chaperonin cofactor prefoldin
MSLSDDMIDQLQSDLQESENNYKMLERECEEMDSEIEYLKNELQYCLDFQQWLAKVYPNAEKEYSCIRDIERSV